MTIMTPPTTTVVELHLVHSLPKLMCAIIFGSLFLLQQLKFYDHYHQYFLFKDVLRIPYNFEGMNNFMLKYNFEETAFELYTLKDI